MNRKKLLIVSAVLLAMLGGLAAQGMAFSGPGGGPHWKGHGPRAMQGNRLQIMAIVLDLSQAQQAKVKEIAAAERTAMKPWTKQLWENRRDLRSATANGAFDEAQVRKLATKIAQARTELIVSRHRMRSKIFAVLTPKQKALAEKLEPLLKHRRGHRRY